MPINDSTLDEFAVCAMERANELAKAFREEINVPMQGSNRPPLIQFCCGRLAGGSFFSNYLYRNEKLLLLIEAGADVNAKAPGFWDTFALDCAVEARRFGY